MKLAQISPGDTGLSVTGDNSFGALDASQDIGSYIGTYVITPLFSVMGLLFFLLMLYAGFLWMTAAGNPGQVDKAKRILISAVIGLLIVFFALAITYWVLGAAFLGISNIGGTI
jgi:hypothetical protein